jgi:integrase
VPAPDSIVKVGDLVVRFKTKKFGVAVYRQRYLENGVEQYSRPFYFGKTVNKKLTRFPLGVDMKKAESLAEEIASFLSLPMNTIEMAMERYNPRVKERRNKVVTFTELLKIYGDALGIIGRKGKAVSKQSFAGYATSASTALRKVESYRTGKPFQSFSGQRKPDLSPWLNQSLDVLTRKWVMDLKLSCLPPPPEGEEEADEEEILTAKISCDTTLRCTRALFSKQAMRYYKELKLNLPDLSGFLSEPDYGAKKYFQLLPPDVIVKVAQASLALRAADLDAYRAYLLCMNCGLRRGEAIAFSPAWIQDLDKPTLKVTVRGAFNPKHGTGRKATIEPWVATTLRELGPVQQAVALDRLNDWLKDLIPAEHGVSKAVHELRKCWVSYKAKTEGIHVASSQAGHRDVKTTSTSYADNMMADSLLPLWKEPTEAAVLKFKVA